MAIGGDSSVCGVDRLGQPGLVHGGSAESRWRALCPLACVLLTWVAAGFQVHAQTTAALAPLTPVASAASAAVVPDVWAQLERIERGGAARAAANLPVLDTLLAASKPGSLERLEMLALRGAALVELNEGPALQALLDSLQNWPDPRFRNAAQLAEAVVRAQQLTREGKSDQAYKAMAVLPSQFSADVPLSLMFRALVQLCIAEAEAGRVELALGHANQALQLAERSQASWRRAAALSLQAYALLRAQQHERAASAIEEALQEAARDPDPMLLYRVHNTRGVILGILKRFDRAQASMQLALNAARDSGSPTLQSLALANSADFYLRQGNFAKARQLSEEGLALARRHGDSSNEALALHNLGIALIQLRQIELGKSHVMQSIAMSQAEGLNGQVADSFNELGEALERMGDLAGAARAFQQYRRMIDQQLREETRSAVLELQAQYDDDRRGKEMALLARDRSLKLEQLRARDLQLQLWAAVGACVVLSALLLGLAYQRIRKTNQALAHSNAALKVQGERDPLTGLANRRHFQTAIVRLAEQGRLHASVFLIDIDHFKRINDSHGHAVGDAVLVEVAQRLRSCLRDEDLLVRWGGEEFLIVIDIRHPAQIESLAQRLLDQIASTPVRHGPAGEHGLHVSASMGFCSFPVAPHGWNVDWERAIALVDTLMYMAKAHGRNRAFGLKAMAPHQAELDAAAFLALSERMEEAWRAGELELVQLQGPVWAAGEGRS
jgi:diguanylate cyclase (GGDEF)-like protein